MQKKINRYLRLLSFKLRKKIDQKYVIIESDDWGLERAKDFDSLEKCKRKYGEELFSRWSTDALETTEDLDYIYDLMNSFKSKFETKPVITANFITHNIDQKRPDFLTFKSLSQNNRELLDKYNEGISLKYFKPQLHGFSHYNNTKIAQDFNSESFQEDIKNGFPLIKTTLKGNLSLYRGECFDPNFEANFEKSQQEFKAVFGFFSATFVPPNYLFSNHNFKSLNDFDCKLLQASNHFINEKGFSFMVPLLNKKRGVLFSVRNARIDPQPEYNYLSESCIKQIEHAFKYKMPAVLDIHRVNFSGKFMPKMRMQTIEELEKVLLYLYRKHPETIFVTSDQLATILTS
jgi:hypothetical protein